jgi:hypothetical protein
MGNLSTAALQGLISRVSGRHFGQVELMNAFLNCFVHFSMEFTSITLIYLLFLLERYFFTSTLKPDEPKKGKSPLSLFGFIRNICASINNFK